MNKAQGRRHSKLKGYYERQYAVTAKNKARRAARRERQKKLAVSLIVILVVVLSGCSNLTVSPKPVNARVIAFDESTQNAGVIDCDQLGCLVTKGWVARYAELEKEFKHTIAADQNIKMEGAHYRISYEVYEHFAELKAAQRGP
jgi:hypothetical protein